MKSFKKIASSFIVALALILLVSTQVFAATLQVTSIGTESVVSGSPEDESYTGSNPTITGVASPEAEVDITIDDLTTTVVADVDGDWSYTPTGLTGGVYEVEISSNLETLTFTLTITSTTTTSESTSSTGGATSSTETPDELLQAGTGETIILTIAGGMFLIGLSVVMSSKKLPA